MAGCSSTSRAPPSTDTAVAPTSVPGCSDGPNGGGDVLQGAGVGRGDEQHGQVGLLAELLQHLADDLAGGVGRPGGARRGRRRRARSARLGAGAGGSRVNGTTVTAPMSMRQWASIVP